MTTLEIQCAAVKRASRTLSIAGTAIKNRALESIARALIENQDKWLRANSQDLDAAKAAGMRPSLLDRLALTPERVSGVWKALGR